MDFRTVKWELSLADSFDTDMRVQLVQSSRIKNKRFRDLIWSTQISSLIYLFPAFRYLNFWFSHETEINRQNTNKKAHLNWRGTFALRLKQVSYPLLSFLHFNSVNFQLSSNYRAGEYSSISRWRMYITFQWHLPATYNSGKKMVLI